MTIEEMITHLFCGLGAMEVPLKCHVSGNEVPWKCRWSDIEVSLKCKQPTANSHSHRPSLGNSPNIHSRSKTPCLNILSLFIVLWPEVFTTPGSGCFAMTQKKQTDKQIDRHGVSMTELSQRCLYLHMLRDSVSFSMQDLLCKVGPSWKLTNSMT